MLWTTATMLIGAPPVQAASPVPGTLSSVPAAPLTQAGAMSEAPTDPIKVKHHLRPVDPSDTIPTSPPGPSENTPPPR